MTIASEITRLQGAKSCLKASIEAKGVTVPNNLTLEDYYACVDAIATGGDSYLIRFLGVAGGGGGKAGGGTYNSGTGGGGGEVICSYFSVGKETEITIGQGGTSGNPGGDTILGPLTMKGGCSGANMYGGASGTGCSGGSNNGQTYGGGGGGGAGGNGGNAPAYHTGGSGGSGLYGYGGGGGGGGMWTGSQGGGGYGPDGGGYGGTNDGAGYNAGGCGGGGGGGGWNGGAGGTGGGGLVDICYKSDGTYGFTSATGGDCCFTCGDYCVHRFTSSGTFTIVS